MKKAILILSHHNFLEQALSTLPELSGFEFTTSTTLIECDFLHILYEKEFSKLVIRQSGYQIDPPININEIVDLLVNLGTTIVYNLGDIRFNFRAKELTYKDDKVNLTETESRILAQIIAAGENGVSKEDLAMSILGYAKDAETKTVENHLYNLKNKLSSLGDTNSLTINKSNVVLHYTS